MHDRLIKIVDAESSSHKKANDYVTRRTRELAEYPCYFNPLVILSIEIYKLDEDVINYTSLNSNVSSRNYKDLMWQEEGQSFRFY